MINFCVICDGKLILVEGKNELRGRRCSHERERNREGYGGGQGRARKEKKEGRRPNERRIGR